MTTVVQKQTSSLHVCKMHLFCISYVFDLYHHCYRTSTFFWGTFALTFCHWHLDIKYCFGKTLRCLFLRVDAGSGCELLAEDGSSWVFHHNKNRIIVFHFIQITLAGFLMIYCLNILKQSSQKNNKICRFVCKTTVNVKMCSSLREQKKF